MVFAFALFFYSPFPIVAIPFYGSPLLVVLSLLLLQSLPVSSVCGCAVFISFTPYPSVSLRRSSMPSSPKHPDAPRLGSARHIYGELGISSAAFPVQETQSLPPVPLIAESYPATEPAHLSLSTATPLTAGLSALHTHARPRALPGNDKASRRTGFLQRGGVGRTPNVPYWKSCSTHVPNGCRGLRHTAP